MKRVVMTAMILGLPLGCSDQTDSPTAPASMIADAGLSSRSGSPAGKWTEKVTGGGMAYNLNGCGVIYQNVSATGFNGPARGQVQITTYRGSGTYPDCVADQIWFKYHGVVTDLVVGTAPDGSRVANVCYNVTKIQVEPSMQLNLRFGIAIKEGGNGSGDMTRRALNITCLPGEFWGDDTGEHFGAVMQDGNYNIRSR